MNWKYGIILTFVAFASLMGTLAYKSINTKIEMVSEEYYKDEIKYQNVIDASHNSGALSSMVQISQQNRDINFVLPSELVPNAISGDVQFYCAYDQTRDLTVPLKIDSNGHLQYDQSKLKNGTYQMKINLVTDNKTYYLEKDLTIN
jgi:hypothetical protein